ncbi:hypothetical protein [Streptomyces albicerus]|uniref:hypothetical protein n=1 Tax=Streptomyces albicerus TaxID=2569859 RepID=UPI00124B935E|nr:hypothetical protein [Streptomyces albicerus]
MAAIFDTILLTATGATAITTVVRTLGSLAWERVRNQLRGVNKRRLLTFRYVLAVVGVSAAVYVAFRSFLMGGIILVATAGVRLLSPRGNGWGWDDLDPHIGSETFFHSLALLGVALGMNGVALGTLEKLSDAQKVTISLTLVLGALVAVNKSTARTRKLCTEVIKRTDALSRAFTVLHAVYQVNKIDPRLLELREHCREKADDLCRLLDTRLNTGYRFLGTQILPKAARVTLEDELRTAIEEADEYAPSWHGVREKFEWLEKGCAERIDELA